MTKLLNYKNWIGQLKQNEYFESQLEQDNLIALISKEEINQRITEFEDKSKDKIFEDNPIPKASRSKMSRQTKKLTDSIIQSDSDSNSEEGQADPNAIEVYQPRYSKIRQKNQHCNSNDDRLK